MAEEKGNTTYGGWSQRKEWGNEENQGVEGEKNEEINFSTVWQIEVKMDTQKRRGEFKKDEYNVEESIEFTPSELLRHLIPSHYHFAD